MAVGRVKTWIAGEVLTASDLNAEFNNILNNAADLANPLTKALDMNGFELILDADADTSITADTDDRIDFKVAGADLFRLDGTTASVVNGLDFVAAAAGSEPSITAKGSDTDISITLTPKGSGTIDLAGPLNTNSQAINQSEGSAVASATTTNIWATDGDTVHVTGTTTITSLGTAPNVGAVRWVIFDGALTLTHGANLNLQGSADITTAAGDFARVYADTTTQFDVQYFRANGQPVVGGLTSGTNQATTSGSSKDFTIPSGVSFIILSFEEVSSDGTAQMRIELGDSGGIETSGYTGRAVNDDGVGFVNSGAAWGLTANHAAANLYSGHVIMTLIDSSTNHWVASANLFEDSAGNDNFNFAGQKTLSAELTTVRFGVGADTFDNGSVNVLYM